MCRVSLWVTALCKITGLVGLERFSVSNFVSVMVGAAKPLQCLHVKNMWLYKHHKHKESYFLNIQSVSQRNFNTYVRYAVGPKKEVSAPCWPMCDVSFIPNNTAPDGSVTKASQPLNLCLLVNVEEYSSCNCNPDMSDNTGDYWLLLCAMSSRTDSENYYYSGD